MQQSMRVTNKIVRMYLCLHVHICATESCASTYVTYPCVHAHGRNTALTGRRHLGPRSNSRRKRLGSLVKSQLVFPYPCPC